ncbi:hypothetical protein A3H53_03100 [Candidatus Nomurabacteria bacterium RIFCSPLOWO2_02_FULL_40_10]|uniref:Uncharacterized protein n=1 Tax=Candidatus Nomurabacteria bacterium RIFCSPLOWO2_02_FULL_40_10 TaxID=1801786 RepID=A0A1F6XVI9_9BACT|nr:MAG: hypothetical protein A3H53_03100 [Candidatus Nomurabacteria bacterium RIFCSPLOWO2_02_FULL_40_10]
MTEKLQQTIQEEVIKLPKEAQEAINFLDWIKIAEEIGKKYLLNEEEINNFQLETLLVLIGVVDPEFYAINIENQVGTTKDSANKMADEAFEKIFKPIGEKIEENIKNGMKNKNPGWEQTLNFILSGGNYATLIAPTRANSASVFNQNGSEERFVNNSPLGKTNSTPVPKKMTDIKSKFVI